MFVGGFAGWCLRGCAANSKYAFVAGQLAAKTDTIKLLEKQMETRRQDDNDVITQLKIDASELKRERDTTRDEDGELIERRRTVVRQFLFGFFWNYPGIFHWMV
jgi:hypothetical protein